MFDPKIYSNQENKVSARQITQKSTLFNLLKWCVKISRCYIYILFWKIFRKKLTINKSNFVISYFDFRTYKKDKLNDDYFRDCYIGSNSVVIYKLIKPGVFNPGFIYLNKIKDLKQNYLIFEEHEFLNFKDIIKCIFESKLVYSKLKLNLKNQNNKYYLEFISGSIFENLISDKISKNILKRFKINSITYPWENLVWERLINLNAKSYNVKTIGFQHTGFSKNLNQHFVTDINLPMYPIGYPDQLYCNGVINANELKKTLLPSKIGVVRALRQNNSIKKNIQIKKVIKIKTILLTLSYNLNTYELIFTKFIEYSKKYNVKVLFKIHPIHYLKLKKSKYSIYLWENNFDISNVDIIISHDNSWIFESMLIGIPSLVLTIDWNDIRDFNSPLLKIDINELDLLSDLIKDTSRINDSMQNIINTRYLQNYFNDENINSTIKKLNLS